MEKDQSLILHKRSFQEEDLENLPAFVIAAGEDTEENHKIAALCRERRIPVNVVDDPEYCDFIFPSLIARGNLSIGISTGGASPSVGKLLRQRIEEQIPDQMEEILDYLQEIRPQIAQAFSDKKERFIVYSQVAEFCMTKGRPLTEEELAQLVYENFSGGRFGCPAE